MCAERSTSAGAGGSLSRKNSRQLQARVFLLDDSVHTFSINSCALGSELFIAIIEKQVILESDYFDLEYVNTEGVRCWIDHTKSIVKQVGTGKDLVFIFAVKFYTPHPNLLEEEYTRYLFALQIKRDIVSGQLICSTNTSALLASYIAQAEIGDFLDDDYLDNTYLRQLKLVNQPTEEVLNKIMDFHKTHIGMSPSEADFHLLDTARKIEYYGVKMHLAKDHENLPLNLSVTHMGVVVFQNLTKINTFSWAKIRKLSFKRKKFLIKLHPEGYGYYKGMVEFYFETRDDCKRFWKKCIEHHSFFRCPASDKSQKKKPRVVTKGSSFRYCGRTQKELIEHVRENYSSKRDHFERPTKARVAKSPHSGKHGRLGKSYHPFAIKSSYSAPSRAVSDSSDLNRTGMVSTVTTHTPRQQRSVGGVSKPRWSHSAGQSPHNDAREAQEDKDHKDAAPIALNSIKMPSQKRSRKGRKYIQVSRTGSSADEDDDKRVTASEMSLSSSGRWETNVNGPVVEEEPMPAKEAFRGTDRLCRQRASIGGIGDVSDSDHVALPAAVPADKAKLRPVRQASEPTSAHGPESPGSIKDHLDAPQRIVCIDQYRSRRPRNPDSLPRSGQQLSSAKRYKSTPNDVAACNPRLDCVDQLDSNGLMTDIPYVLLRRHKSPEETGPPPSVKSASQSRRSLVTKSLKSVKDTDNDTDSRKGPTLGQMRHSKSLDRRLVALDSSSRHIVAPKSPKLLREEYMQNQRRPVSDRATIEALKNQLRASSSVRNMARVSNGGDSSMRGQASGPMFVSAYRLPPVNNFSAKDDTMSPQTRALDRIYRDRSTGHDGDDEVDKEERCVRPRGQQRSQQQRCKDKMVFSDDSDEDSQLRETTDLESLLGILPGNPIYLNSSSSSDDGEFDISPDRCSRPRSVSENEFKLRTPRSSRRSSICRGHTSSLSLTDSSFNNSDASFQSDNDDDGDLSGSPYSFLADCSQNQDTETKNVQGSSGDSTQLPGDSVPTSHMNKSEEVNLQVLEVPVLMEESPDEEDASAGMAPRSDTFTSCSVVVADNMSIDREDESVSFTLDGKRVLSNLSSTTGSSSDRVVIVTGVSDLDATMVDHGQSSARNDPSSSSSFSQVLESMLQKRLTKPPFLRTSTPTEDYSADGPFNAASTDRLHQDTAHYPQYCLKPAISAPGLTRDRVSPFSPLPAHLRRPFTSSSSSNSSSSSSLSPPNSKRSTSNNPFSQDCNQPDVVTANNIPPSITKTTTVPSVENEYEKIFEESISVRGSGRTTTNNPFVTGKKQNLDRALVFLNEGALSSISVGKSPTESGNADKFQETVEGNLMSYESSEYTSRAHSTHDEEEPDEYVLPSDHRSLSLSQTSGSSSSQPSSDTSQSGEYPATQEATVIAEQPIEEEEPSDSSNSTSEGSEEIEPFPPPPPQSDMLIFDERDEDIFQQMQQRDKDAIHLDGQVCDELPKLDCTSPTAEFPQPPPPIIANYPQSKDDLSSSEVPSLFADDSTETSVMQIDDVVQSEQLRDTEVDIEEEVIVPKFCSLLYDNKTVLLDEKVIRGSEGTYKSVQSNEAIDEENNGCEISSIIPKYYSIVCNDDDEEEEEDNANDTEEDFGTLQLRSKVETNEIMYNGDERSGVGGVGDEVMIVSYEDAFPANDPLPCSFDLSQLNCQSPQDTLEDGEC